MDKFRFLRTPIEGLAVVEPRVFDDARGYFVECFNLRDFEAAGIPFACKQQNVSASVRGVLRGMHYQVHHPQAKLVRVNLGEVFDVAVDVRRSSPTFGSWYGVRLSADNRRMLYLPRGMAHGFLVMSERAEFMYLCDEYYHPEDESGFRYDDPAVGIDWPELGMDYILSEKDLRHGAFEGV